MANSKSAKKRILVIEKKTEINKAVRSKINTYTRKFKAAVAANDVAAAEKAYSEVTSVLDKAVADNCAARRKARFATALNELKK